MPAPLAPLRVAIVNDSEIVVAGVAAMLGGHSRHIDVVELDNRVPVLTDVDIVLLDTFARVPGEGIGLVELVRHADRTGAKVVVFTWSSAPESIHQAVSQGAAGHLSKALAPEELVQALLDVHAGQRVTLVGGPDGAASAGAAGDWPGRGFELSPRESEVLALIARGLSNQEIADALYLSVNSVKTYIRTAYRKIGVRRRPQAVLWAIEHGFRPRARRTVRDPGGIDPDRAGY
ncbi:MAG: response regulator transcription factor [Nocardioides sp.]|jgi:NarL family two-component system response regulator LiaR|nr:response regulator transcription factor [Nocardioides sp.]